MDWNGHLSHIAHARYPALLAYANMLTAGDRAAAEDLVQDAVVRTFSRHRGFRDAGHAEAYTRRAILSVFLDGQRRRRRLLGLLPVVAENPSEPSRAEQVDTADQVRGLLARLAPQERACVVLRYFDDLPLSQIAERTGLALGTVKRYLHDATARLGAALGEDEDGVVDVVTVTVAPHSRSARKES